MKSADLQVIHQNAFYTLSIDRSVPATHIVWHGFISSADFRVACQQSYELMREHRFTLGISDARHLRIISLADQQWFMDEYVPLVRALGLGALYSAVIMPLDFFGRQSVDSLASTLNAGGELASVTDPIVTQYFDTEDAARLWLQQIASTLAAAVNERELPPEAPTGEIWSLAA